ncbi:YhgE/Pip domain-containing protein [Halalkalibacter urbisdiaboli]|uniref:YhgE/Pip domain-containing protein n=1 Tax=Halalkalibacter urbisdiaboli TaxID=1960589 RepID=UPI000B437230|nr:ABC transporter permease [Halalkalibacter urbisdiaboli]
MKIIFELIKQKTSLMALGSLLIFQLVFGIVWLTSYSQVQDKMIDLPVGVVIENEQLESVIDFESQVDLNIQRFEHLDLAAAALQDKQIYLLIHLTDEFAQSVMNPQESPVINYYVNDANPLIVSSVTNRIEATFTSTVNDLVKVSNANYVVEQLNVQDENKGNIVNVITKGVNSSEARLNEINTFSEQMIPLMMILAAFTGSMVMAMFMNQSVTNLKTRNCCKWRLYLSWLLINVVCSLFIGLVSSLLVLISELSINDFSFFSFWMFQTITLLTFMLLTSFFVVLFGQLGMAFNIFLLSAQLVTSGTLVPQLFLTNFYEGLSEFLPATYVAEGIYRILFTDLGVVNEVQSLVTISGIAIFFIALTISCKAQFEKLKEKKLSKGVAS